MLPSAAHCGAGHCWEGQRPVFVSSLPRALLFAPFTPFAIYTFPLLASLSPPSLPPSDSDHVSLWYRSHYTQRGLRAWAPLREKERGPTNKKYLWKATGLWCCKSTLCLAIRTAAFAFMCVCTSVSTWLLFQRCVTTDSSFGYLCEAPGLREGAAAL